MCVCCFDLFIESNTDTDRGKQMLDDEMIVMAGRRVSWSLC